MLPLCALDRKPEIPIYALFLDRGYFWLNWFSRELAAGMAGINGDDAVENCLTMVQLSMSTEVLTL